MLAAFITANRPAIIALARARVVSRTSPTPSDSEVGNGVPVFLDQLAEALRVVEAMGVTDHDQLSLSAGLNGQDLFHLGLTVAQVVRVYGDVCQAITELAVEQSASIPGTEFQTLNLCIDDAIAEAVTQFSRHRERAIEDRGTERLGVLAHELRNLLNSAMLSFESLKSGRVAVGGSTGLLHGRSLMGLRDLIDRSFADVRLDAGIKDVEPISVTEFIEEVEIGAAIQAQATGMELVVSSVDRAVTIDGDRQFLAAALANLLQNAFKFTPRGGRISLAVNATADRVFFEVADGCGGLPAGDPQALFQPFHQRGADRSGMGLGLAISLRAAKANGGAIHVQDFPGKGCTFTLDLPRSPSPMTTPAA